MRPAGAAVSARLVSFRPGAWNIVAQTDVVCGVLVSLGHIAVKAPLQ